MKTIHDPDLLNQFINQYHFKNIFETPNLPFSICQYDKGEIINNIRDSAGYLHFVVKGNVQIYSVFEDGSRYQVGLSDGFTLLGDIEFCDEISLPFLVEAVRKVTCIELPLYECRDALLHDNTFLRFLLHSISHKFAMFSKSEACFVNLGEKLLHYFKYDCPGRQLQGIDKAAVQLHCSRRQLQRLLRSLTDRQIIEKIGKGRYRLISINNDICK